MERYRRQRCGAIDSRLLRDVKEAERAYQRSRGANRMTALQVYAKALHHFTHVALQRLALISGISCGRGERHGRRTR